MRECIKRATCNVNQMGEFWCFFILTSWAEKFLNRGLLKRVLLYYVKFRACSEIGTMLWFIQYSKSLLRRF
jgi:hypothetical protein